MSYHYEVCYVLTQSSAVNLILLDFWLYLTAWRSTSFYVGLVYLYKMIPMLLCEITQRWNWSLDRKAKPAPNTLDMVQTKACT